MADQTGRETRLERGAGGPGVEKGEMRLSLADQAGQEGLSLGRGQGETG